MDRLIFILFLIGLSLCGLFGFGASLTFQWPGFLVLGLAALLSGWKVCRKMEKTRSDPSKVCLAAGGALAAYVLVRGVCSPVTYLAREDLALAGVWFAVWALAGMGFSRSRDRAAVVRVLIGLALVNLAFVVWQSGFDPGFWILPGYSRTYLDRAGGIFNNPNHLAGFLAAIAPFFIALAFWGRTGPHRRVLLVFLAAMCLLALALTQSRGGLLAAGAGLAVLTAIGLWLHRSAWRQRLGITLAALGFSLLAVAGLAAVNFAVLEQRFGAGAFTRAMEANRPLMWQAALKQNAESPVLGTGSRTYFYYSRRFRSPEMHVSVAEADFAHNEYLQMLADYGWAGAGLLGFFVLAHGWSGLRLIRRHSREHREGVRPTLQSRHLALTAGSLAGLAALGAHASVDFLLHVPAVAIVAAVFLGILANPGHVPRQQVKSAGSRIRMVPAMACRIAIPLTGAALLFFGAAFVRSEWHFARARKLFAGGEADLRTFGHLYHARELDPANPFAHSLSGHAHLFAIDQSMPAAVRLAYLEKSRSHFEAALEQFPQDIYALLGLAGCLDALERHEEAGAALDRARVWAPLYGNILHAQGNHHLRTGDLTRAEQCFAEARDAGAFRDWRAASRALERVIAIRRHQTPPRPEAIAGP